MSNTLEREMDTAGNSIYRVPEANLSGLKARIEKLNKRAKRLHMEPLVLSEIGEEFLTRKHERPGGEIETRTIRIVRVTLTGTCPRVNGWAMAATIQHDEGGNILRTVPGFETTLPLRYRTAGTACDHCNVNRARNDTYVLQSDGGEWKQVGRNCLADFLRTEDASGLAQWAEILAGLDDEMGGFENEDWSGGGGQQTYFGAVAILTQVACCVRADGWCSRTEAKNSFAPKTATVDMALCCFDPKWFRRLSERDQAKLTPTAEDETKAVAALAWAAELPADVTNDYLWNIRVVAQREHIGYREAGLAGSIIAAFNRHLEQEMKRKYERDHPSQWFGTIKERAIYTLTVMGLRELEGQFGLTTLVMFRDQDGNRAKWFCSGSCGFKVDREYIVKATVKDHQLYKDSHETLLTRVEEYDAAAIAQQKADAKVIKKVLKAYKCDHAPQYGRYSIPALDACSSTGAWYQPCCEACEAEWTAREPQHAVAA